MAIALVGVLNATLFFAMLTLAGLNHVSSRVSGVVMSAAFGVEMSASFVYPNGNLSDFCAGLIVGTLISALFATASLLVLVPIRRSV